MPAGLGGRLAPVREQLLAAGFTVDGLADLLGPVALGALARGQRVPVRRALVQAAAGGGAPADLAVLVRLLVLGETVALDAVARVLPAWAELTAPVRPGGERRPAVLVAAGSELRARLEVRPYADEAGDYYVVSDLPAPSGAPVAPDTVPGVGSASLTLAQLAVREPVATALDLGTGCGVQLLHLARHAAAVTGTDTNPRALDMAAWTAALSGVGAQLLAGDRFGPVAGRRFDLVVSNPPFVVGGGQRLEYRDGQLAGDELVASLVATVPNHLAPGGWCQLLANWLHVPGQDWRERVAGWLAGTGLDAWVVQREVADPARYAETWLRDADDQLDQAAYGRWLDALAGLGASGVGFGWICLRAGGHVVPTLRLEEATGATGPGLGAEVAAWFARTDLLGASDDAALAAMTLRLGDDVRLVVRRDGGAAGWGPPRWQVARDTGLARTAHLDALGADVLGRCDGVTPLGTALAAAATAHGLAVDEVTPGALGAVRALVEEGVLLPPG